MLIKYSRIFYKTFSRINTFANYNIKQIYVSQGVCCFSSQKKKDSEGKDENITIQYTEE